MHIKICGLTRRADILHVVACGADFIGLVFAESPRKVTPGAAVELLNDIPPSVKKVALFMDQDEAYVRNVVAATHFDILQFHGRESNRWCRQFGKPFIKAIPMGDLSLAATEIKAYPDADGLLLDSHAPGRSGGSGETFDWSLISRGTQRLWLAGGLDPGNVARAIAEVRPWAVDVSSGVERAPGIKDHELVSSFIKAARAASFF